MALAVVQEAVQSLGVSVKRMRNGIDHLFRLSSVERPNVLGNSVALIMPSYAVLMTRGDPAVALEQPAATVDCGHILERLSDADIPIADEEAQPALPFPPSVVGGAK